MEEENTSMESPQENTDVVQEQDAEQKKLFKEDLSALPMGEDEDQKDSLLNSKTLEFLFDLELPISVELARKEMRLQDIVNLDEGSIVEFDKIAGESVDILVNNKKIAEGEVVVIDDRFGVRIVDLVNPADRIKDLTQLASS